MTGVVFTPGPWRNVCFQVLGPKGEKLCHTGMGNLPPSRSHESEANARLIAAAPDLLEALVRLEKEFVFTIRRPLTIDDARPAQEVADIVDAHPAVKAARAAIAKARNAS